MGANELFTLMSAHKDMDNKRFLTCLAGQKKGHGQCQKLNYLLRNDIRPQWIDFQGQFLLLWGQILKWK